MDSPPGSRKPALPAFAAWLLGRLADPQWREEVEGDIEELYARRLRQSGPWRARWRLGLDVLSAARIGPERFAIRRPMRQGKGTVMLGNLSQDLKHSFRRLSRSPGFAGVCILTFALGIGANTAMFSVINGVLLEPLPYHEPHKLVRIHTSWKGFGYGSISAWEYLDILEGAESLQDVALYRTGGVNLHQGSGVPQRVGTALTTPSLLTVLGVIPQKGRALRPGEEMVPRHRVALLSDGLWKRRFGGDDSILGETLNIGGESYEIVGIMPRGFQFPYSGVEIWVGYGLDLNDMPGRGNHSSRLVARLDKGVSLEAAQSELEALSAQLREEHPATYPEGSGFQFVAEPLSETMTGSVKPALLILMGAVGLVLLIACANVAGLLLARINTRQREIAIRKALGAGGGRLIGQVLFETLLLSLVGGLGALAVAQASLWTLRRFHPGTLPRLDQVALADDVLYFNLALIVIAALAAGLVPALRMARSRSRLSLNDRTGQAAGFRQRIRRVLVVKEVALAAILLLGAGLLIRSFQHLLEVAPGFQAENVLTARISLPDNEYPDREDRIRFHHRLLEGLQGRPGVISAGVVNILPMSGSTSDWSIGAEGYTSANPGVPDFVQFRIASSGYFETLRIPLVKGRYFEDRDAVEKRPVVILSETLAIRFWGEEDPIGRRIKPGGLDSSADWLTVVGVVGDVHHSGAREGPIPIWYRPLHHAWNTMSVAVRTAGDPGSAAKLLADSVRQIDPRLPLHGTQVMTEMVSRTLSQERFNTNLLLAFAGLALGLAVVGVYGVISFSVSRRRREIGIRMAIGAPRRRILLQVLREGILLIGLGLGLGLLGAIPAMRFMDFLLFGVASHDPLTFLAIAAVLLAVGVAACLGPARRATRVDPIVALRCE